MRAASSAPTPPPAPPAPAPAPPARPRARARVELDRVLAARAEHGHQGDGRAVARVDVLEELHEGGALLRGPHAAQEEDQRAPASAAPPGLRPAGAVRSLSRVRRNLLPSAGGWLEHWARPRPIASCCAFVAAPPSPPRAGVLLQRRGQRGLVSTSQKMVTKLGRGAASSLRRSWALSWSFWSLGSRRSISSSRQHSRYTNADSPYSHTKWAISETEAFYSSY